MTEKSRNEFLYVFPPDDADNMLIPTEKSLDELQTLRNDISRENPELELLT